MELPAPWEWQPSACRMAVQEDGGRDVLAEWVLALLVSTIGTLIAVFVAVTQLRRALANATAELASVRSTIDQLRYSLLQSSFLQREPSTARWMPVQREAMTTSAELRSETRSL